MALDRDGNLLRAFETPDGRWRLPVRVSDVDPRFFALLKAYEDKRFAQHHGVDFGALRAPPGNMSATATPFPAARP